MPGQQRDMVRYPWRYLPLAASPDCGQSFTCPCLWCRSAASSRKTAAAKPLRPCEDDLLLIRPKGVYTDQLRDVRISDMQRASRRRLETLASTARRSLQRSEGDCAVAEPWHARDAITVQAIATVAGARFKRAAKRPSPLRNHFTANDYFRVSAE